MLAVLGLIAFAIAALLNLLHMDPQNVLWLVIVGGILICAHGIWGWYGTSRWGRRTP
jgi:hypothetical protein